MKILVKVLIGLLLAPIAIFAVGVVLVLAGVVFNSVFEAESDIPSSESEAPIDMEVPEAVNNQKGSVPAQVTQPTVSYATAYYDVSGLTAEEIRANKSSARKGTFLAGHDAATTAKIDINFKRRQLAGKCEAVMDRFSLALTYTYPRLKTLTQVSPEVAAKWNQFMAALKVHEEGHAKIEIERAGLMLQELQKLPPSPTCEEFDQAWQAKADKFDAQTKQIEATYDQDTKSGQTQGVRF